MFLTTHIDLGTIKVDTKHTLHFPYENIPRIISIQSPCDCSSVGDEPGNKRIVVNYKTKPVPAHLKTLGYTKYAIRKAVFVKHTTPDGLGEVETHLVFIGEVKE